MRRNLSLTIILGLILCGVCLAEEAIKNGLKKEYYPNGEIKSEVTYKNGIPSGTGKIYFENGSLAQETVFLNGDKEKINKIYYTTGQLYQEIQLIDNNIVEWKVFNKNGVLRTRRIIGQKDFIDEYYDEEGKPMLDGIWKGYSQDGQLSATIGFKEGKKHGEDIRYNDQGKVEWIRVYENGQLKLEQVYDKSGKIKFEKKY